MTREERIAQTNLLLSLHRQAEDILLAIPGVLSVDIGLKEKDGQVTEEITFRVNVDRKKSPNELAPADLIPKEILGVKTDVVEPEATELLEDTSEYRPIKGGIQIGNGSGAVGTLGCMALRTVDNVPVILSNHHVMFASGKGVGDKIGQPDYCESCCCSCGEIGTIAAGVVPANGAQGQVDAAIATVKAGIAHIAEINQIGPIAGTTPALPGETVRKMGRTTGLTTGTVLSINAESRDIRNGSSTYTMTGQVRVVPAAGVAKFADRGDSGSVIVNQSNQVVALLWGANTETGTGTGTHIAQVMTALGITIPASGGVGPANLFISAIAPVEAPSDTAVLVRRLERTLRQSEPGLAMLNVIQEFRSEVMNLINHNRAVGVTWQRRQGPAYVAALFRSLKEPSYHIPHEIEGITARGLLMGMAAILDEHGSPRLRAAIDQHALTILEAADGHDTIEEILFQLSANSHQPTV